MTIQLKPSACAPPWIKPWLIYQASLTDRLRLTSGDSQLSVLRGRWDRANTWDKHLFSMDKGVVFHREIITWVEKIPCWYARTIIPISTYQASPSFFDKLQDHALGTLIFNEPRIKRIHMQHYQIQAEGSLEYSWVHRWLPDSQDPLWVRLSLFSLSANPPFALVEILLPGLESYA